MNQPLTSSLMPEGVPATAGPPSADILAELRRRGLVHDFTPEAEGYLARHRAAVYCGFDPTADSLHLGNLVSIMLLVHFQRAGHRPVAVVGGATGMVGDPSGKSAERNLLDEATLRHNEAAIKLQLERFLDFTPGPTQAMIVNNYDWTRDVSFLTFLRDIGKHLTVSYMMAKDSVQRRLDTGLSFTEFSYQLLQAFDFVHLYQTYGVRVQVGGSDQWGNITSGTELIRRMTGGEAYALTAPLLTKADGSKFGKSEQGNVWLDGRLTSPYKFYQFLLNQSDADVDRLLRVFSLRSVNEIEATLAASDADRGLRLAQRALAEELTTRVHGAEALARAIEASEILFGGAPAEALTRLSAEELLDILDGVPQGIVSRAELDAKPTVVDFVVAAGALPSKGEARRLIQGGGLSINKTKVADPAATLGVEQLLADRYVLIQKGKRAYHLAVVE
jgi:tyrosyl-tRNA synthetase